MTLRTMLFLLFFSSLAMGQVQWRIYPSHDQFPKPDSVTSTNGPIQYWIEGDLLSLLKAYQAECWADSMQKDTLRYYPDWTENGNEFLGGMYRTKIWVRKQPTFPGFILWLEKRKK